MNRHGYPIKKFPPSASGRHVSPQIQHELHTIRSCMQDLENQYPDFIEKVQKWVLHRRKTIRVLHKTAQELDDTHRISNVAQCIGDGLAILGGIGEIVGLLMEQNQKQSENAGNVKKFGKALGGIGAAASFGTQFIEDGVSMSKVEEVKDMLKEDESLLQEVAPWLERSRNLNKALESVFEIGFNPNFEIKGNIAIFRIIQLYQNGRKTVSEMMSELAKAGYEITSDNLKYFAKFTLPMILDKLDDIFNDSQLYRSFKPILEVVRELPNIICDNNYLLAAQSCIKVFTWIASKIGGGNLMRIIPFSSIANEVVDRVSYNQTFKAVAKSAIVASRIATLMSTGDELMKNTPSQYSKALRDAREQMIDELNRIVDEFEKYFEKYSQPSFAIEYK